MQGKLYLDQFDWLTVALVPYAIALVIMGFISIYFIVRVLMRQIELFKMPISADIVHFRRVLFGLAVVVAVGNFIPLVIDLLTVFYDTGRPPMIPPTSLVYSLVTHLTLIAASYLIYRLYQLAHKTDMKPNTHTDHSLINDHEESEDK